MKCASVDENTKLRNCNQFPYKTRTKGKRGKELRYKDIRKKISLGTPQQYETPQIL